MTTTKPTESVDLDRLEQLARAATPGPWSWWTSNSMLRLTGADGQDGGVLCPYYASGHADLECSAANQAYIAAANPATLLALIALARRAPAQQGADERAAFEATMGADILADQGESALSRAYSDGNPYTFLATKWAYRAWQAARATQPVGQAAPGDRNDFDPDDLSCLYPADDAAPAAQAVEPTPGIPQRAWSKEAEMTESWIAAQAVEPAGRRAVGGLLTQEQMDRLDKIEAKAEAALAELAARTSAGQAAAGPVVAWIATDLDGRADVGLTKEAAKSRAGEGCTEFIPLFDLAAPTVAAAGPVASIPADLMADLCEAIGIARHRAEHAGSTARIKRWDAVRDKLSAAAGDAKDAALEQAAIVAERFGPSRPIVAARPSDRIQGRWEGEQAASSTIAALIRGMKSQRAAMASPVGAGDQGGEHA